MTILPGLKTTACLCLLFAFAAAGPLAAQDVLRFRGNAGDGFFTDPAFNPDALHGGAKILWQAAVKQGFSAVALKGDRLYTMGNDRKNDTVWCLNAGTGAVVWQYSYPCGSNEHPGPRATPTVDGDVVYTLSLAGHLHALNANTGTVVWKRNLVDEFGARLASWALGSSVVVDGDMLLVNTCASGVALNKKTGATIWASKGSTSGYATPVLFTINGKKHGAFFGADALYGVELATGKAVWRDLWITSFDVNAADPLVFGNKIFITSGYGKGGALYEFTGNTLSKKWSNRNLAAHFTSPVHKDGFIYGISGNSGGSCRFVALNANTGEIAWSEKVQFGAFSVVNGAYFFTAHERGELTVAEFTPASYRLVSSVKLKPGVYWTAPVVGGGRAFIRNGRGDLFCIDMQ